MKYDYNYFIHSSGWAHKDFQPELTAPATPAIEEATPSPVRPPPTKATQEIMEAVLMAQSQQVWPNGGVGPLSAVVLGFKFKF
jgi:hypothetical protein